MGIIRRALAPAIVLFAAACTFPPLTTPMPSPTPTPPPTASPTPSPSPTPTPSPTPAEASIPRFGAGEVIETTVDGMRVRQRPGSAGRVLGGLLPRAAALEVVMGPISTEGFAWYLVTEDGSYGFGTGWIAAGFAPDPFLVSTGERAPGSRFLASFAQTGDAEYGPVTIQADADHAIRWAAMDPEGTRCSFAVGLATGSGAPVPAIRATIGADFVPGTLQPNSFAAIGVNGEVFVSVTSDCAWTLVFELIPEATPEPSPSD